MPTTKLKLFNNYPLNEKFFDEVFKTTDEVKKVYEDLLSTLDEFTIDEYKMLNEYAKRSFMSRGVTFATYNENPRGVERIFPFDLLPRIISKTEWDTLSRGLLQRTKAINLFLKDIYNDQHIIKDGIVPADLLFSSSNYCQFMKGFTPPGDAYCHISGTDLIRHSDGEFYVLEDNVRCPSGVSYVMENREAMKKSLSQIFKQFNISTISEYPARLLEVLKSVAPKGTAEPTCVVLTPGAYNSAYYEHTYLAQSMGIQLVEGSDLFVENDFVYMNTVYGAKRVDVVYRRIDDDYIDPLVFKEDSLLGVPGIMSAYKKGNVTLVNAPGTGVADDKAVYIYVPEIIRYYLNEEPILKNVPTYRCGIKEDLDYVLEHLPELVVKPVDQSGGYGIFMGHTATAEDVENEKKRILANPRDYIAQPIMNLSTHATYIESKETFEPRHIDLRAFTLIGNNKEFVLSGGLSRVALKEGNLVVNSSQGGGSKDTWIVE